MILHFPQHAPIYLSILEERSLTVGYLQFVVMQRHGEIVACHYNSLLLLPEARPDGSRQPPGRSVTLASVPSHRQFMLSSSTSLEAIAYFFVAKA